MNHPTALAAAVLALAATPALARTDAVVTTGSDTGLGAGVTFTQFTAPALNSAGQVAFWSRFSGPGINSTDDAAIFRNSSLATRLGDVAPDPLNVGDTFTFLSSLVALNDVGWLSGARCSGPT